MELKVGINYFAGWWRESPNKWQDHRRGEIDWRENYPNRIPINGCFNEQRTMDADIITASKYGVDYFLILWYPLNEHSKNVERNAFHLNEGLEYFIQSPESHRMEFAIEYCNHPPFAILTDEEWEKTCQSWESAFRHPSYLTFGEKLVFKIHGLSFFLEQCGHDRMLMKKRLNYLKKVARKASGRDMLITAGVCADADPEVMKDYLDVFDYYSTYMDVPAEDKPLPTDYPYKKLFALAEDTATRFAQAGVPYMPYLPGGWNPRPWYDPRPSYAIPTGEMIEAYTLKMAALLEKYPILGVSEKGENVFKSFNIYAWNEFGEGGYMAPTLTERDSKLQGLCSALKQIR